MLYSLIYEPKALMEFEEAFEWYWERSPITAENFEFTVKEKSGIYVPTLFFIEKSENIKEKLRLKNVLSQ